MFLSSNLRGPLAHALLLALILAAAPSSRMAAQQAAITLPSAEPSDIPLPIPEDRGAAAFDRTLKQLRTTASVMMIVAHPDDEDGALLAYLSRGLGARCILFTLTRGEGGQNAMGGETYDALALMRTNELLKADESYGAKQLWGTEADFGFSKTQEESFARWTHERVLYDAVLAVRSERPQVIVATFMGGVSDGHGQHQVSGEIAQEVFKAAADPTVFPEQLKPLSEGGLGLTVWQPLAVYSRTPFARISSQGIFDYATGKFAPVRFHNYITGEWTTTVPGTDATAPVGKWDAALGRSYLQIAREGWGEQKSQYGGASPALSGPANADYHLWGVAPQAAARAGQGDGLFANSKVYIDPTLTALAQLVKSPSPAWLTEGLHQIQSGIDAFAATCPNPTGPVASHKLAPVYRQVLSLYAKVKASDLDPQSKASVLFELDAKIQQFQSAFKELLGLDVLGFTARASGSDGGLFGHGGSADEMPRSVTPGEKFHVRVHTANATAEAQLTRVWLESQSGSPWAIDAPAGTPGGAATADRTFAVQASADAQPTQPFFTRPNIEQPYYEIAKPELRERSFAPWPLDAWAEFTFDGLPIRLGQVVQTLEVVRGPGGIYQPLVVTPAIGVRMEPEALILPLDGSALPVRVMVHAQSAAEGTVSLKLPEGWRSEPVDAHFHLTHAGDGEPLLFSVTPAATQAGAYSIQAVAHAGGRSYTTGWRTIGYQGLRPYNQYKAAELKTRKVDVKLASGLRIGYIMGTGDTVPEAIEGLGLAPHILTQPEIDSGDYSAFNVLVLGIRAYTAHPELVALQPRLEHFTESGGTLIVQYQSETFPAPLPLAMGRRPEVVVDESAPVKLLAPSDPLLTTPNVITAADFDGWVEERGHSFLDSWDAGYTALTETADAGQDPQRGGLLVTHPGKGTYIYVAYALYRQFPELVPGAYRLLANILSAGHSSGR